MSWWQFSLLGAAGGVLVEVLALFRRVSDWQTARRTPTGLIKQQPPRLRRYIDVPAHAWILAFRALLGAGTAALFGATGQISGAYVAVALGVASPSVLAQLGSIPQVATAVRGAPAAVSAVPVPGNETALHPAATYPHEKDAPHQARPEAVNEG